MYLGISIVDNSFVSSTIYLHFPISLLSIISSQSFSLFHNFCKNRRIFIVVGDKYPRGSNKEAKDARICLLVVSIINLSSSVSPELLTLILSFDHLGKMELDFHSRRFIDFLLNLDLLVSYNRQASSLLFTPVIRLSTYMSLWMLQSSILSPFPKRN